ncbi:hypothetical protein F2Q69_00055958 [Brassica cretica]|uniref:Uncharacterized protein n=1 Tax=Brassica cretica TaxID=69181 RepID=A0A8S9MT02_BRACR|nr:hypothetical protein F2Q69_00055958 [Brassica cretica]
MSPLSLTAAADCSAMPDPYLRDLMLDWSIRRTCYPRNRTTKRTSNGRELERVGVEVARADRCRVASWLIGDWLRLIDEHELERLQEQIRVRRVRVQGRRLGFRFRSF